MNQSKTKGTPITDDYRGVTKKANSGIGWQW